MKAKSAFADLFESLCTTAAGRKLPNLCSWFGSVAFGITAVFALAQNADADLVGFWSGNGSAIDSTGNNSGTLVNGVTFAPGLNGQRAFSFNGSDYVQAGTVGLPTGNQARTLDLWFNVTSNVAIESYLAGYGGYVSQGNAYEIFVDNGNGGNYGVAFSPWFTQITGSTISFGQWYNLAVTNTGDSVSLYLDGELVASATMNIDTTSGTNFYIGDLGDASIYPAFGDIRQLNGLVQDVAIYNIALSQSDIQNLMVSETPEPSTLVMLVVGSAALFVCGIHKRRT